MIMPCEFQPSSPIGRPPPRTLSAMGLSAASSRCRPSQPPRLSTTTLPYLLWGGWGARAQQGSLHATRWRVERWRAATRARGPGVRSGAQPGRARGGGMLRTSEDALRERGAPWSKCRRARPSRQRRGTCGGCTGVHVSWLGPRQQSGRASRTPRRSLTAEKLPYSSLVCQEPAAQHAHEADEIARSVACTRITISQAARPPTCL